MRPATLLKYLYLSRFSKPVGDRVLYRALKAGKVHKILEIGLGSPTRTLRMLDLAGRLAAGEPTRYAAIDMFEARPADRRVLSLKEAHRLLKPAAGQIQLVPGDASAVARVANSLANQDLVIISAENSAESLAGAWFYLPRMLHPQSLVLAEGPDAKTGQLTYRPLELGEIQARAMASRKRRAA